MKRGITEMPRQKERVKIGFIILSNNFIDKKEEHVENE